MPIKKRRLPNTDLYRVYNGDTGEIYSYGTTLDKAKKQIKLLHMIDAGVPLKKQGGEITNKQEELTKYSDINKVYNNAKNYFDNDFCLNISTRKDKKYMVLDPTTNKWIHFGQMGYKDGTLNDADRNNRIKRFKSRNARWANSPKYSASALSYYLLW